MTSQLIRFQGTWVAQVRYVIEVIGGIAGAVYEAVPMVKYNGVTYIADKGVQPTLGSNPATDTAAWSVFDSSAAAYTATAPITLTSNAFGLDVDKLSHVAAVAPITSNDETEGYFIGSLWTDSVTGYTYTCTDATEGAAVWTQHTVAP